MKIIYTSRNQEILVDDEDYEFLNQFKWKIDNKGYACRTIYLGKIDGKYKYGEEKIHRIVMGNPIGLFIDHKNGVRHDNQKVNLRPCSSRQNQMNTKKSRGGNSQYKGVFWCKRDKAWKAVLRRDGKFLLQKNFRTEKDAALAYNDAAQIHFGEFASLNIIVD